MINLKYLAESGRLGEVHLHMSSDKVRELLGDPDHEGGATRKSKWNNIWKYGDIELGFDKKTRLLSYIAMNFSGEDRYPEQGDNLKFESWIIKGSLPISEFILHSGISLKELNPPWNDSCRELLSEGGMHLIFGECDSERFGLLKFVVSAYIYT